MGDQAGQTIAAIGRPPWKVRRLIVYLALFFCAAMVVIVFVTSSFAQFGGVAVDNELNRTIVTSCFFLAGSVIGAFVFGAVWDDRNVMQILGPQAYQDQLPYQTYGYGPSTGGYPVGPDHDGYGARQ
ncbi:MAG: hypothetical protein M9955_17205 [Rhizobiaceae bacterium]|nr:hypothetical protein [Rhizobiaceae bacterium]